MKLRLSHIPGAFELPRPRWDVIGAWIARHVPAEKRARAWSSAGLQWLHRLNKALGGTFAIAESDNLRFFAPASFDGATGLLEFGEMALGLQILGELADENRPVPLTILFFPDHATYYHYLSYYFPEGEFGGSGGSCFKQGYVHIALGPGHLDGVQLCLAHELTHACLAHLTLPLWLEEGLTQYAEERLHTLGQFHLDSERAQAIKTYWHKHGLQDFWWGKGFFLPDEGQSCSYDLARILMRILLADYQPKLREFFGAAHHADAGAEAASDCLGLSVSDLAAQFLGPGDWQPRPPDALAFCRRGQWYAENERFDDALADLNKALEQNPRLTDALTRRGSLHLQQGRYGDAVTDYEHAIQLDPNHLLANNNLAWVLATCRDARFRDAQRAVRHAVKACEACGYSHWFCLGTLAAAYAETEDFEEARTWARESLRLAPEEEQQGCRDKLRLYKENKPYRETSPAAGLLGLQH